MGFRYWIRWRKAANSTPAGSSHSFLFGSMSSLAKYLATAISQGCRSPRLAARAPDPRAAAFSNEDGRAVGGHSDTTDHGRPVLKVQGADGDERDRDGDGDLTAGGEGSKHCPQSALCFIRPSGEYPFKEGSQQSVGDALRKGEDDESHCIIRQAGGTSRTILRITGLPPRWQTGRARRPRSHPTAACTDPLRRAASQVVCTY